MNISSDTAHTDSMKFETERQIFLTGVILAAFIACWAIFFVPMSNDESNHYHPLACWTHPFSHLESSAIMGCDHRYDLVTPFGFTIQRSLNYIGVLPSLLYAPVYFLAGTPASLYWFGLAFFLVFTFLMSRLSEKPWLTFSIILAFYPLSLNFIHDMGPVKFDMLLYPLGAMLVRRAPSLSRFHTAVYAMGLAVLFGMAFEEKPFFIYLLPGLAFFYLAFAGNSLREIFAFIGRTRWALLSGGILAAAFIATILFSVLPNGYYYFELLQRLSQGLGMPASIYAEGKAYWGEKLFKFFLFWPSYAHRFLDVDIVDMKGNYYLSFKAFTMLVLPSAALLIMGITIPIAMYGLRKWRYLSPRAVFLTLSAFGTLLTFLLVGNVYASHHFVYVWVPLLVLFTDFMGKADWRLQTVMATIFFAANTVPILWLTQIDTYHETSSERTAVMAYFNGQRSEQSIVNYITWGNDFIHGLYGPPNQIVTSMASATDLKKLFELSQTTGRTVYFVCHTDEAKNPFSNFLGIPCSQADLEKILQDDLNRKVGLKEVLPGLDVWHVYEVLPD